MLESVSGIYALLPGIYALQQWHIAGAAYSQPQVDGRFVLGDGAIIAILQNRIDPSTRSSATLFGRYRLDANTFAYGYDAACTTMYTADGIVCNEQLPWQGMREFTVSAANDSVRIVSLAGTEEFIFARDGFTYAEQGAIVRRWVRLRGAAENL
jgi:hypothetical protein